MLTPILPRETQDRSKKNITETGGGGDELWDPKSRRLLRIGSICTQKTELEVSATRTSLLGIQFLSQGDYITALSQLHCDHVQFQQWSSVQTLRSSGLNGITVKNYPSYFQQLHHSPHPPPCSLGGSTAAFVQESYMNGVIYLVIS